VISLFCGWYDPMPRPPPETPGVSALAIGGNGPLLTT
jgi:hypothetical protein